MNTQIDPDFVAQIVRKVIARLRNTHAAQLNTNTNATAASISDKVVTAHTIESVAGTPAEVFVAPSAVVTPAALDVAKQRGIRINRTIDVPPAQQPSQHLPQHNHRITDTEQPLRAQSLRQQLMKRGITELNSQRIILSDTPATDLHRCIATESCRAAMVSSMNDVDRFHRELQPSVWVFDMGRMSLIAAVNAAARIAQLGN